MLGQLALCHLPNVDSYKLEIMSERLGIELDDAHDADADVSATTNVAAVLTQRMRSEGGVMTGGGLAISKAEKVANTLRYSKMEEVNVQTVDEPKAEFRTLSDRGAFTVRNADNDEILVEISGYDLQVNFNMEYLNSIQDVEAAVSGIGDVFRQIIMEKLLEYKQKQ